MNKYDSSEDANYIKIRLEIQRLVTAATAVESKLESSHSSTCIQHIKSTELLLSSALGNRKYFIVPYARNDIYTPREEPSKQLHTRLAGIETAKKQSRLAVHGLGGAGYDDLKDNIPYT